MLLHLKKKVILLILLVVTAILLTNVTFLISSAGAASEYIGNPVVQNFTPAEYSAHSQNFAIDQNSCGVFYIANVNGVLEYDGTSWNLIRHPDKTACVSLAIGVDNKVYIGCENDFGYLETNKQGSLVFKSLVEFVPDSLREFSFIWRVFSTDNYIWFQSRNKTFRWDTNPLSAQRMKIWSYFQTATAWPLFKVEDQLILQHPEVGFSYISGDSLTPIPGLEEILDYSMWSFFSIGEDSTLIFGGKYDVALFHNGKLTVPETDLLNFAKEYTVNYCARINENYFVAASNFNGIAIFDKNGKIHKRLNRKNAGFDNTSLGYPYIDCDGFLWLPLAYGISRVDLALEKFDYDLGLDGGIYSINEFNKNIFVGTSTGLYKLVKNKSKNDLSRFQKISNVFVDCWGLVPHRGYLIGVDNKGLFQLNQNRASAVRIPNSRDGSYVSAHPESPYVFVGGYRTGLDVFKWENGNLIFFTSVKETLPRIRNIICKTPQEIWLGGEETYNHSQIQRVKFSYDMSDYEVTTFDTTRGLKTYNYSSPLLYKDRIYVSSSEGIWRLNDLEEKFVKDFELLAPDFSDTSKFHLPFIDRKDRIWFGLQAYYQKLATPDNNVKFTYSTPLSEANIRFITTYYQEEKSFKTWFGGKDGKVFSYDERFRSGIEHKPVVQIKRVVLGSDSLIYGGHQTDQFPEINLKYSKQDLRFEFALAKVSLNHRLLYQYRLIGYSEFWSAWSSESYRDFNSLFEGKYRFEVRAKDSDYNFSDSAVFEFTVLPPWHRSPLAYLAYILIILLTLYMFDKLRERRRIKQQQVLENTVENRTHELNEAKEKIRIHNEELEELLEKRSRELIKSERQAAFGQMVQGIVHNLRSPLTVNIGAAEMIEYLVESIEENDLSQPEKMEANKSKVFDLVSKIKNSNSLMHEMLKSLMRKSKTDMSEDIEVLGLNNILRDELEFLKVNKTFIELHNKSIDLADYKINIEVVPGDIAQVFQNLVNNSMDAMADSEYKELTVKSYITNQKAVFEIRDTGPGIPEENFDKIFDPFFTTKKVSDKEESSSESIEGTGLGLWMCRETIKSFNGTISLDKNYKQGASFVIEIPQAH